MLNLEINDVNLAIRSLHSKLKTKDIQFYENTRETKNREQRIQNRLQQQKSV